LPPGESGAENRVTMAENLSGSDSSAVAGKGILERPTLFLAVAGLFLALYLHAQWQGFGALTDLSTLAADNGLRLQEVRDLIGGQAWFDTHQYRYLPPEGTLMHWSRLVDAPLAAALFALTPAFGSALAERIVLTAWPVLLFALYCALVFVALRRSFGTRAGLLGVAITPTYLAFRDLFGAGEIDHHNVQIVLTLAAAACFAMAGSRPRIAIAGGLASALSLAVGLETLPFVALIGLLYGAAWVVDRSQARAFALFAVSLAFGSLAASAAQTSASLRLAPTCDTLSLPWLILTLGGGAFGLVAYAASDRFASWPARLALLTAGGLTLAGAFALAFPYCLAGPYGAVPKAVLDRWLEMTGEALTLGEMLSRFPDRGAIIFGPAFAATIAAWIGVGKTTGEARRLLLATATLLTLTLLLSLVQIRAIYVGAALVPVAAGFAFDRIVANATTGKARLSHVATLLVAGLLLLESPWLSVAALTERAGLATAETPHDPAKMRACLKELPALDALPPGTILGPLDLGAHVLFLTKHSIVSAGYHRNVEGVVAGVEAFAGSENDMRKFAERDHADYVALCLPWIEAYPERYGPFAKTLAAGEASPPWLNPVPLDTRALKLWRVAR
jgi:hypothetical protein